MNDCTLRYPALTYVTDEDLGLTAQQRVLESFVACASDLPLRVAFRLPSWSDSDFSALLDWYFHLVEDRGLSNKLDSPLIHDRPEAADAYPGVGLWLPWRNRDLVTAGDVGRLALSVHSEVDAHEAVFLGASELVFGHVFTSESHPGEPGRGVAALNAVSDSIQSYAVPPRVTAIGGINEHTIHEIGANRHKSVAAIRVISRSPDIALTLARLGDFWTAACINADLDEEKKAPFGRPSSIFF